MSTPDEELISTVRLAKLLDVNARTVTRWASEGVLPPAAVLPGGQFRWRYSEVLAQLQARREDEGR